ncbi:MAG: DUF1697 domain-containing protein [Euzebya sp.]
MTMHVAFLRAINVGGRRVTNDQLTSVVADAGFDEVATFIASGNVVFDPGSRTPARATEIIEEALADDLGFLTEVFVRTAAEIQQILDATPFEEESIAAATGKPQITFLHRELDADTVSAVHALGTDRDRLVVDGRHLHWLPADGVSGTNLDMTALGKLLGPNTVRTRNTLVRIQAKFLS